MIDWLNQINPNELVKASFGGIVGFVLAQLFNIAKIARESWLKPRFEISQADRAFVTGSGGEEYHDRATNKKGRYVRSELYGFDVRNVGRSVAAGVRVRLIRIERRTGTRVYEFINDKSSELLEWNGDRDTDVVLPPGSSAVFFIGKWNSSTEDFTIGDVWSDSKIKTDCAYRLTVVVFDLHGRFVRKQIEVQIPASQYA